MTATEARLALLLRAFEHPLTSPWTHEDSDAADREAQRQLGSSADAERFIAARAALGTARLIPRVPAAATALSATALHPGWAQAMLVLAALAGAAADAAGSAGRINVLAPPLLALMAWNLVVYLTLAWAALRCSAPPAALTPAHRGLTRRWLERGWQAVVRRAAGAAEATGPGSTAAEPIGRYLAAWWQATAAWNTARLGALLHAAAAVFALAALGSLYVRGLGFEYRAGWDSTFLGPAAVQALLGWLFGPAAALTGIALPAADELARMRFSNGVGENAARWIHLQAVTVLLIVVLPRLLLAAVAHWRAQRAGQNIALPLHEPDLARLARLASGSTLAVAVLPYSFEPAASGRDGLRAALEAQLGGGVAPRLAATVPLGGEDTPATWAPALRGCEAVAVLFSLTATPERETHGAFAAAVAAQLTAGQRLLLLVDEAAFRQRFTGADGTQRVAQRRDAWRRMLGQAGREPLFVTS